MANLHTTLYGIHAHLVITSVPAGGGAFKGKLLSEAGAINVAGAYECEVDVGGKKDVSVNLRPSAITGTIAPNLETRYLDGNQRDNAAGASFVANTNQELSLALDPGMQKVWVKFTVDGGESVTFNRGEVNAL